MPPRFWVVVACASLSTIGAVDFATEIHPILSAKCLPCHSGAAPQAKLHLGSRAAALGGGVGGPAIVPGKPAESLLLRRVLADGGLAAMPPTGSPLKPAEIDKLRRWIEEGAIWPESKAAAPLSAWNPPLAPRKPALPEAAQATHPVDRFLLDYWAKNKIAPPAPVNDAQFARRLYYDIWGLPPTPAQLAEFEASDDPEKRPKLATALLANADLYTGHWISFWNDMLRNDIGVVYHGERKAITAWLRDSLKTNKPYRAMLGELLNPKPKEGPDGFLIGVNWRGDINASQTPFMQASQNTAQVFLGINLKCASCHDSFINKYQLSQAYGLAAYFADKKELELVRCDMKTGKMVKANFLYPELAGQKDPGSSLKKRRKAAAQLFTDPQNGRTSRTLVNRYWKKLIGRGLVEPVDEMDNEPWHADLLDWLASDFDEHDQNLRHLIERIVTSIAYQAPTSADSAIFKGPSPRRITAEQFADSASAVTGEWRALIAGAEARLVRDWQLKSSPLTRSLGRPIRDQVYTSREDQPTTFQALELSNGSTLEKLLHRGSRKLLDELPAPPPNLADSKSMRRGTVAFNAKIADLDQLWLLVEDAGSYDPGKAVLGWANVELLDAAGKATPLDQVFPEFAKTSFTVDKDSKSKKNYQLAGYPLTLGATRVLDLKGKGFQQIRGAFFVDKVSRASDIGIAARFFLFGTEPDREQLVRVVGKGPTATAEILKGKSGEDAARYFYRSLLSRDPNPGELQLAASLAAPNGDPLTTAGIEDLLWTLLLHPEFQYLP